MARRPWNYWTKGRIVAAFHQYERETGQRPKFNVFKYDLAGDNRYPSSATVANRFGSWNKAMEAAGLEPNRRGPHDPGTKQDNRELCLETIQTVALELGRQPSYHDYVEATGNRPSIESLYGTWGGALKALGWKPLKAGRKPRER